MELALKKGNLESLNHEELEQIEGGGWQFLAVSAAITAGVAVYNTAHTAGESVGKAIYRATH